MYLYEPLGFRMKNIVNIFLFTAIVSAIYTGIAQILPQLEGKAPPKVEFGANTSAEDLAVAGGDIFETNCTQCHAMSEDGRCPPLGNIGALADSRARERGGGFTGVDYLVEALCKPGDYLVDGYGDIMPPQQRAMKPGQLQAVVAYLQTLGGDATLKGTDIESFEKFGCGEAAGGGGGGGAAVAEVKPVGSPAEAWAEFGCEGCHSIDSDEVKTGPSLKGIGTRMKKWEILDALINPDATIADGYGGGVMEGAIAARDFYSRMSGKDYKAFVDWLSTK
jgi:cytochrome c2